MRKVKIRKVPVHNLTDLVEIVTDHADMLVKQTKFISRNSGRITILSWAMIGFVIFSAYQHQKLEEQVYNLSVRVKKLEYSEGE